MRIPALAFCLLLAIFVGGCKKGNDVVGKWKGSMALPASVANSPQAEKMKGLFSDIPLELKADHTFTMTPLEGTWAQTGTTVSLTVTKMAGLDVSTLKSQAAKAGQSTASMDKPLDLEVSADGNTLTGKDTSSSAPSGGGTMTFTRDTSK